MWNAAGIRTRWAAVGAAVAVTLGAVGVGSMNIASADVSSGDRPVYIPIDGCRLIDTRSNPDFNIGSKSSPFGPDQTVTLTAHGSNGQCTGADAIPTDAVGLALNITPVGATIETFLTVWGEGADPGTSALNPAPGQPPTPNAVNTPLSATGTFNVRNNLGNVDVIIDIAGYYAGHDHDDRYYTETEIDRDFAPIDRELVIGGYDLEIQDGSTEWGYSLAWTRNAGADACLIAPIHLQPGWSISELAIRHSNALPADISMTVIATVGAETDSLVTADVAFIAAGSSASLPANANEVVDETVVPGLSDPLIRPDYHYHVQVCSADDMALLSAVVRQIPPDA